MIRIFLFLFLVHFATNPAEKRALDTFDALGWITKNCVALNEFKLELNKMFAPNFTSN
jgi:hypothetical protein